MIEIKGVVAAAAVFAMVVACLAAPAANAELTGDVKKVAVEIGVPSGDSVRVGFNYNTETMLFDVIGMNWKVEQYQMTGNVFIATDAENPPDLVITDDSGAAVFSHVRAFILRMPDGAPALSCALAKTDNPNTYNLMDCFPTIDDGAIVPFTAYEWEILTVAPGIGTSQVCQVRSVTTVADAWEINAFLQAPEAIISEHLGDFHIDGIREEGIIALSIIPGYGSEPWMAAIQNTRAEDNWAIITSEGPITVPQMSDAYTIDVLYYPIVDPLASKNIEIHVHVGRMDLKSGDIWEVVVNGVPIIGVPLADRNTEIHVIDQVVVISFDVVEYEILYSRDGEFHLDAIGVDGDLYHYDAGDYTTD